MTACSGYIAGSVFCAHGFPQSMGCNPGRITNPTPPRCQDEEWCGRVYADNGGKPNPAPLLVVARTGESNEG